MGLAPNLKFSCGALPSYNGHWLKSLAADENGCYDAVKAFCRCNIWKYTYRADSKNGEEDRKKAEWYMDYLMKMEKMTSNKSLLGWTLHTDWR